MSTKSKKIKYGLSPKHYPRNLRERIDYDYLEKLTPTERDWLADFSARYYRADFTEDPNREWSTAERRKSYSAKNAVNHDYYSIGQCIDGREDLDSTGLAELIEERASGRGQDQSPIPVYLDDPRYKTVLDEVRAIAKTRPRGAEATEKQVEEYEHRVRLVRMRLEDVIQEIYAEAK